MIPNQGNGVATGADALGQQQQAEQPPANNTFQSRLGGVTSGRLLLPWTALVHGPEKVGKSSFGQDAPDAIFVASEEGTSNLDVRRYPEPRYWEDMQHAIYDLTESDHKFKTLVIDTVDWFEPHVLQYTCRMNGWSNIEDPGFGKGQVAALEVWRGWLHSLEVLRRQRGMNILLLAHSATKTFKNPTGDDFDRYELKLGAKTAALVKEWVEDILFATFRISTVKGDGGKRARVRGSMAESDRLIYTQRRAPFDAGNRHSLPSEMPLDFRAYARAVAEFQSATPEYMLKKIEGVLAAIGDKTADRKAYCEQVRAYVKRAEIAVSVDQLSKVSNKVLAKAATFDEEAASAAPAQQQQPATQSAAANTGTGTKEQAK